MGFGGGAFIASPLSVWLMSKFSTADPCRRRRDLHRPRRRLLLLHDGRRRSSCACRRRAGSRQGYVAPAQSQKLITTQRRLRLRRAEDAAVLADLVGALPERDRRHRRARPGLGHEPGDVPRPRHAGRGGRLRRPDEPVQHGRPLLLGLDVGLHRPQEHLFRASSCSASCSTAPCPTPARSAASRLFVLCFLVIISACMAAASPPCRPICRDMFGTRYVGAIHGLLLTAWSMAGIFGPVLVNYIREYNVTHGVPKAQAYNVTMYIMAGLLVDRLHLQSPGQGRAPSLPHETRSRSRARAGGSCRRGRTGRRLKETRQ